MYITSTSRLYIQKYFTNVADATAADDRFEVSTPANQKLVIDEEGADTALWNAAGVTFYTADFGEFFDLRPSEIAAAFPDTSNESLFASVNSTTKIAGSAVTFGEGAYGFEYNNSDFRVQLYIPTIMDAIEAAATDVINCQCDCEINSVKAQKYIKMRAYLDLILYKAQAAIGFSNMPEINTMVTTLTNFVGGTDELCGTC